MELFATRLDYEPVIRAVEARHDLNYVLLGLFTSNEIVAVSSALNLVDLGVAFGSDAVHENHYMVLPADKEVVVRAVPQRSGGTRYAVDLLANPSAFDFQPGGLVNGLNLVSGSLGVVSSEAKASAYYCSFIREIKRHFTYINGYWVGPDAVHYLHAEADTASGQTRRCA